MVMAETQSTQAMRKLRVLRKEPCENICDIYCNHGRKTNEQPTHPSKLTRYGAEYSHRSQYRCEACVVQHCSLREFAARRMNVGGKGSRTPYLCEPNGEVARVAPSIIRRKLKKGWIRATALPDYYIRCGTPDEEEQALSSAQAFWTAEQRRQQSCHEVQAFYNAR